jgi:hypothetical protein
MFELTEKRMVDIIHECMADIIHPGDTVCDCTMGNGHDTLMLSQLTGREGIVYSFDIQQLALERTAALLSQNNTGDNVRLILASHSQALAYIHESIRFFVFNLGYLPDGDPGIITKADTTLASVKDMLSITEAGGGGAVLSYYGHCGGSEEKEALEDYLQNLPPKYYSVMKIETLNRKNTPPVLYLIKKLRDNK